LGDAQTVQSALVELADIIRGSKDAATLFNEQTLARLAASQFATRDLLIARKDWGTDKKMDQERDEREEQEKAAELSKELPGKIQQGFDDLKRQMGEN
jgi:hypothetical protein